MGNPLVQGSQEWLQMRRKFIGASDAAIIMGVSPWRTPYQLWQDKLGMGAPQENSYMMQRGTNMEPVARAAFEEETGIDVFPQVVFHPEHKWMMASLDGLSFDEKTAVEIKCPGKKAHQMALDGEIPEYYMPQLQHQMSCLGIDSIYYYSFDGYNGTIIKVKRDCEYISKLLKEEEAFWSFVTNRTPPPLDDKDYVEMSDFDWELNVREYVEIDLQIKELKEKKEASRATLITLSKGRNSKGSGLTLSSGFTRGKINYDSIPELIGVDLDKYRGEAKETWRITYKV